MESQSWSLADSKDSAISPWNRGRKILKSCQNLITLPLKNGRPTTYVWLCFSASFLLASVSYFLSMSDVYKMLRLSTNYSHVLTSLFAVIMTFIRFMKFPQFFFQMYKADMKWTSKQQSDVYETAFDIGNWEVIERMRYKNACQKHRFKSYLALPKIFLVLSLRLWTLFHTHFPLLLLTIVPRVQVWHLSSKPSIYEIERKNIN